MKKTHLQLLLTLGVVLLVPAMASAQYLYVTDTTTNGLSLINTATNAVQSVPGTSAHLDAPTGIALDTYAGNSTYDGDLFIANSANGSIVAYNPTTATFASTNFAATEGLVNPEGISFDSNGNLYVANASAGGSIDKYSLSTNTWSTYASNLGSPQGIAIDSLGNLFVTVAGTANTIVEITAANTVQAFYPGTGNSNPALSGPEGLAFNPVDTELYVANSVASTTSPSVDRITRYPEGLVSIAPSLNAGLNDPQGIAFTSNGTLFVADYGNNTVTEYSQVGTSGVFTPTSNSPISGKGLTTPDFLAVDSTGLPVPEPSSYAMLLGGLALLFLRQRWASAKA